MGIPKTAIAPLVAALLIIAGLCALTWNAGAAFADASESATPPAAVTNLTAAPGQKAGTATLTWTPSDGANTYWVAGIQQPALDDRDFSSLIWEAADSDQTHQLAGLEVGTVYIFTVAPGRRAAAGETTAWGPWAPTIRLTAPPAALTAAELRRRVAPALARISHTVKQTDASGDAVEYTILGSAFVISGDGLMVTNRHAVPWQGSITARLPAPDGDGYQEYPAQVLGRSILPDLALLRLPPSPTGRPWPALPLGNSDAANLLDEVTIWGYPYSATLGQTPTVTKGVISGRGRIFEDAAYLQTDGAINPGNSGGPMVNRYGEAIGVVTSKISGSDNTGLAIASNEVRDRMPTLEQGGPAQAAYRNLRRGYGYRVDIPAGWYLEQETRRCSVFDQYAGFGDAAICAYELDDAPAPAETLAALAAARWQAIQAFQAEPISFSRVDKDGRSLYRLEYNLVSESPGSNCASEHRIMLVGLSGNYPAQPYGFTWRVGLCESGRSHYDAERQAMLDSFAP